MSQGQKAVGTSSQPIDVGLDTGTPATPGGSPTVQNKLMTPLVTTVDGSLACATSVAENPVFSTDPASGYIGVTVNGQWIDPQNGPDTVGVCYFSGDGGITAKHLRDVVAGDLLYWNGSLARYQLAATDSLSFYFNV